MTLFKFTAGRITFINRQLYALYAFLVFTVIGIALLLARRNTKYLHSWLFVPILTMLIVSYFAPQNQPFRVIFCLVPMILIFTQSIVRFPKIMLTLLVYIALIGNITYFSRPRLQREQWRQSVEHINKKPGLVLVKFPGAFAPILWYGPNLDVLPLVPNLPLNISETSAKIATIPANINYLYLFDYLSDITDPSRQIDRLLVDNGFLLTKTTDFPGVGFIYEYTK